MALSRRTIAECFGTFWTGLTVLPMAYTIGHISGCRLNPAVTIGLWSGGRFPAAEFAPYVVAHVDGAIVARAC